MPQKPASTRIIPAYEAPATTSNHGALSGLTDDDHLQYHTDARATTWLSTEIGSSVQAHSILLDSFVSLTPIAGDLIRWNGSAWVTYPDSNYATSGHNHDHSTLTNIAWGSSGHTGTANYLAGFNGAGDAVSVDPETIGTTNHASLSNLPWTSSGHTGTATRVPYFDGTGLPATNASFFFDGTSLTVAELNVTSTSGAIDISGAGQLRFGGTTVYIRNSAGTGNLFYNCATNRTHQFGINGTTYFQANTTQGFQIRELASVSTPTGSFGSYWVKNSSPNVPMYTNASGTSYQLQYKPTWSTMGSSAATSDATTGVTTGTSVSVVAGTTYELRGLFGVSSGAATNGVQVALNATGGTAGTLLFSWQTAASSSTAAPGYSSAIGTFTGNTNATVAEGFAHLNGYFVCTVSGTLTLWVKSETGGTTVTVHRGSLTAIPI